MPHIDLRKPLFSSTTSLSRMTQNFTQSALQNPESEIEKRLLLFDIDGTLIHSAGAGVHSLRHTLAERFGIEDELTDIEIAGMTDSGIVISILNKHRIP